jgi:hypothetical protein
MAKTCVQGKFFCLWLFFNCQVWRENSWFIFKKKDNDMLSKAAKDLSYCAPSSLTWGMLPEGTWERIKTRVLEKIPPAALAMFIGSVYQSFEATKWKRTPKGLVSIEKQEFYKNDLP